MVLLSLIGNLMGKIFGTECNFEDDSITPCFRPGVLLDCGISWVQFLRRVFIAGCAVKSTDSDKMMSHKCDQLCRASELPVYIYESKMKPNANEELCPPPPGLLESAVSSVRKGVMSVFRGAKSNRQQAEDYLKEGSTKANSMIKYLSEESNEATKIGAIGLGAVTGYILALRGGFFRKLLFSGAGAYAMSALAYPKPTYNCTQSALMESKRFVKIGINFVYGVDPSKKDSADDWQLPQLPKTFDEAWQAASNLGKSATAMITGKECDKPAEEEKQPQEKKE